MLIKRILNRIGFFLPLGVYILPEFQSTYAEDLLLFVIFLYLFIRTINRDRIILPLGIQTLLIFSILSVLHGIAWFGLLRGYLDTAGRALVVYPLLLLITILNRPPLLIERSRAYTFLIHLTFLLLIIVFGVITIWSIAATETTIAVSGFSFRYSLAGLMIFPILACLAIFSIRLTKLETRQDHIPLLIASTLIFLLVWGDNVRTYVTWYKAGEYERSWTPFRYHQPEQIAVAERMPYLAANNYQKVLEYIQKKGDLPHYLNWPFFMRYRMAYQAFRKKHPHLCAEFLPPSTVKNANKMRLVQNLWHLEFMQDILRSPPRYNRESLIWQDFLLSEDGSILALDLWGRVYSIQEGILHPVYKPKEIINDAIDLEWWKDTFLVLRRNGEILSPRPLPFINQIHKRPNTLGEAIDFEVVQNESTIIVLTTYGEIYTYGIPLQNFPDWKRLQFYEPFIADMELDPSGEGYYLLDIYGAVHSNFLSGEPTLPHRSPPIPREEIPYWINENMAIDMELDGLGRGIFVYNRWGEIYNISLEPWMEAYTPPKLYPHRGVALKAMPDGSLYAFEANGEKIIIIEKE